MEIRADGSWFHQGERIGREALVRVFASILRRDGDDYFLVTPVEKVVVRVEDAPFVVIRADRLEEAENDPAWVLFTNIGDIAVAGPDHPLTMRARPNGQIVPYIRVRAALEARVLRAPYYELANCAEQQDGRSGVRSRGVFFPLEAPGTP